jgi:hypothetical protein
VELVFLKRKISGNRRKMLFINFVIVERGRSKEIKGFESV